MREQRAVGLRTLLRDRRVVVLVASTTLFHLANALVMPLFAQAVIDLGGRAADFATIVLLLGMTVVVGSAGPPHF